MKEGMNLLNKIISYEIKVYIETERKTNICNEITPHSLAVI